MFCKLKIPAVFIVTVIYSAVCSAQDLSRRLPTEVEALRGELLLNNRWDFSQQWLSSDRGQTLICNYGDSLLAETVEGRRHWYGLQQDSIIYLDEAFAEGAVADDDAAVEILDGSGYDLRG